jgi:hypothetical protein
MSQGTGQNELQGKTQQLLNGPLKHVRAAALAAALLPLASVAATPAAAQNMCPPPPPNTSGGTVCGVVWNDSNNNGLQDVGETGIPLAKVFVFDGTDTFPLETGLDGQYFFLTNSPTATISVLIPALAQPSPNNPAMGDTFDSDGSPAGAYSAVTVDVTGFSTDFGFYTAPVQQPGTGTPGYWKNHPEAWTVPGITIGAINGIGGTYYTRAQAITWLGKVGKDKLTTMFSSLVPAMLNGIVGNEDSCVSKTIVDANAWMVKYGPLGVKTVLASSAAWAEGEPMHMLMDAYNNGLLCAKHRN